MNDRHGWLLLLACFIVVGLVFWLHDNALLP